VTHAHFLVSALLGRHLLLTRKSAGRPNAFHTVILAHHGLATCRAVGLAKAEARQRSTGRDPPRPFAVSPTRPVADSLSYLP
jgi:hypothetical protein